MLLLDHKPPAREQLLEVALLFSSFTQKEKEDSGPVRVPVRGRRPGRLAYKQRHHTANSPLAPRFCFDLRFSSLGVKISTTGKIFESFHCYFHIKTFWGEGGGAINTQPSPGGRTTSRLRWASPERNLPLVSPPAVSSCSTEWHGHRQDKMKECTG